MRFFRLLLIGAGLAAAGAIMGAVAGMSVAAIVVLITEGFAGVDAALFLVSATLGALFGVFLAPVAAFTFLRHVPLWRLFAEVTLGTVAGGVAAALVGLGLDAVLYAGVAGFFAAGARLAYRTAPTHPGLSPPAGRAPRG